MKEILACRKILSKELHQELDEKAASPGLHGWMTTLNDWTGMTLEQALRSTAGEPL